MFFELLSRGAIIFLDCTMAFFCFKNCSFVSKFGRAIKLLKKLKTDIFEMKEILKTEIVKALEELSKNDV